MLDRPSTEAPVGAASAGPLQRSAPRWPLGFMGVAGLLGAAGVAVGAAGAHGGAHGGAGAGGADLARTSSEFLMVHAVAVLAGSGLALTLARAPSRVGTSLLAVALTLLAVGAALFGGELAAAALLDWRPLPSAAPTGGLCLIAGWLCSVAAAAALAAR